MKTNYYLKTPANKNGENLIILFFSYEGQRLKYSTGQTIASAHWNENDQRSKRSLPGYHELNGFLDSLESETKKIYRNALTTGTNPAQSFIREQLNKFLNKDVIKVQEKNFETYFQEFINDKQNKVKYRTIQKFNTLLGKLKEVAKKNSIKLSFDNMNSVFYNAFLNFEIAGGKSNETTSKEISLLKTFLHWATSMEYNKNLKFIHMFRTFEREKEVVSLSNAELFKLYDFDFSGKKTWEEIRDLFCFACFTGMRYSDVMNLKKANVRTDHIIITTIKTADPIQIPLNPFSRAILEKYNYELPKFANAYINRELKDVAKEAGIDDEVMVVKFIGTERKEQIKKKYELITFHIGRKSYVTLSLQRGMRQEVVMKTTGHKDFKTLKKYIAVANEMVKDEMNAAWSSQTIPVAGTLRKVS